MQSFLLTMKEENPPLSLFEQLCSLFNMASKKIVFLYANGDGSP